MEKRIILLCITIILIVGAIYYLETQNPNNLASRSVSVIEQNNNGRNLSQEDIARLKLKEKNFRRAIEFVQPDGYINTDHINISDLIGKNVILIDFWTYTCINCQRTFPYIPSWYNKYKKDGLIVIGVHTPEFDFEKNYDNVKRAVEKYNITYPVIQDNEYLTWNAYKNRYWPRKYLIDIDGFIVYDHIGEGDYLETEQKIQELLKERSDVLKLDDKLNTTLTHPEADNTEFSRIGTPEIYFGYGFERGQLGNEQGWIPENLVTYSIPDNIDDNKFYLEGQWRNNKDSMELISEKGNIKIRYFAKNVNLVAGALKPIEINIKIDGKEAGKLEVSNYDLYNIAEGDDYTQHILEIEASKGIMAYTFTFG